MAISAEELVAKLGAAAHRHGVEPEVLIERFIAELDDDPLEAFIGIGDSGETAPFDIHDARRAAAAKKFASGA